MVSLVLMIRSLLVRHAWQRTGARRRCGVCGRVEEEMHTPDVWGSSIAWEPLHAGDIGRHFKQARATTPATGAPPIEIP